MKVAVVSNRQKDGVINRFGTPCPEKCGKKTIQGVVDGLQEGGHTVLFAEADLTLTGTLEEFMPPHGLDNQPSGIVFNMAYGIQGNARYTHLPAMLEMAGIPYTGSDPLGQAVALDKVTTKIMLQNAGIPTPNFKVFNHPDEEIGSLRFPLIVKPRNESTSYGLRQVCDRRQFADAVEEIITTYNQGALVEEYIEGREFCVGILGNGNDIEVLPIVEIVFNRHTKRVLTFEDKYHKSSDEPEKMCPAPIDDVLAEKIRSITKAVFHACHSKDYGRVDIRVDKDGNPYVLEINSMASLGPGGSFTYAAREAGYSFSQLACRILDVSHKRYFDVHAPRCRTIKDRYHDSLLQYLATGKLTRVAG